MPQNVWGLPLYEGVDWNMEMHKNNICDLCLPLYEGVDWNDLKCQSPECGWRLPLYEGVDWNRREKIPEVFPCSLPLYEGVDWNSCYIKFNSFFPLSPSLRGSGLKSLVNWFTKLIFVVSLFTREWIEMSILPPKSDKSPSPSLRGSGLKYILI